MANSEARKVAVYLIVQRGPAAYAAAIGHADRLNATGHVNLASFWNEIAAEVAAIEAHAHEEAPMTTSNLSRAL